jgi:hypothetical protein
VVVAKGDAEKKQRFVEWLCTPKRDRDPATQAELAKRLRVGATTLARWKQDTDFLKLWENHYLQTIGSPERKQTLMDTLFKTGSDADDPRHVAAAKTYMEIADGLRPVTLVQVAQRPVEQWTDEQLDEAIARRAEHERHLRLVQNEGP